MEKSDSVPEELPVLDQHILDGLTLNDDLGNIDDLDAASDLDLDDFHDALASVENREVKDEFHDAVGRRSRSKSRSPRPPEYEEWDRREEEEERKEEERVKKAEEDEEKEEERKEREEKMSEEEKQVRQSFPYLVQMSKDFSLCRHRFSHCYFFM